MNLHSCVKFLSREAPGENCFSQSAAWNRPSSSAASGCPNSLRLCVKTYLHNSYRINLHSCVKFLSLEAPGENCFSQSAAWNRPSSSAASGCPNSPRLCVKTYLHNSYRINLHSCVKFLSLEAPGENYFSQSAAWNRPSSSAASGCPNSLRLSVCQNIST